MRCIDFLDILMFILMNRLHYYKNRMIRFIKRIRMDIHNYFFDYRIREFIQTLYEQNKCEKINIDDVTNNLIDDVHNNIKRIRMDIHNYFFDYRIREFIQTLYEQNECEKINIDDVTNNLIDDVHNNIKSGETIEQINKCYDQTYHYLSYVIYLDNNMMITLKLYDVGEDKYDEYFKISIKSNDDNMNVIKFGYNQDVYLHTNNNKYYKINGNEIKYKILMMLCDLRNRLTQLSCKLGKDANKVNDYFLTENFVNKCFN